MATLRELKSRIGSVASSEKITGAMKMISSAKMHKAEGVLRRLTPYRDCVQTVIDSLLSSDAPVESPLCEAHKTTARVAMIVLGSDDGLCGAYNVNIVKGVIDSIARLRAQAGENVTFEIIPVGKKVMKALGRVVSADAAVELAPEATVNSKSEGEEVKKFAAGLTERFMAGGIDAVEIVYMHYYSAGRQRLTAETYLPVDRNSLGSGNGTQGRPCLFEPDAATIFSTVLPMYLLARMQEAFAQNRASEQAARVMAMQSANDNAQKLLEQLRLEYNKLRQQGITTELLDIVGGQARD